VKDKNQAVINDPEELLKMISLAQKESKILREKQDQLIENAKKLSREVREGAIALENSGLREDDPDYQRTLSKLRLKSVAVDDAIKLVEKLRRENNEKFSQIDTLLRQAEKLLQAQNRSVVKGTEVRKPIEPVVKQAGTRAMAKQFEAFIEKEKTTNKKELETRKHERKLK